MFSFVCCPYCPRCPYRAGRVWYSLNAGRWCLCSVVHVVHIKAGGVEALASCCIKGAFCLKKPLFLLQKRPFLRKKPPFRAWICTRGAVCLCSVVHVVYICPYRAASYVLRLWARFSCPRFALFVPMIRPSCPRFAVFLPMRTAAVVVDCKRRRGGVPFGRSSFGAAARFSTRQSLYTSGRFFRVLSILSTLSIFGGVYGIASTRRGGLCPKTAKKRLKIAEI